MKTDWILRLVTFCIYLLTALGFSIWLPEQFCKLIGEEGASFNSCKWQIFGFRFVFILLSLPMELLTYAVVYRNATDMIFKIQLRKLSGPSEIEMNGGKKQKNSSIAYLMDPDVALNRGNVFIGRNTSSHSNASQSNMSARPMLDGQASERFDDNGMNDEGRNNGSALPSLTASGRRGRLDFEFGDESDNDTGDEGGNDQIEEIYRQQMEAAKVASLGTAPQSEIQRSSHRRSGSSSRAQSQQNRRRAARNNDALRLVPTDRMDDEDEKEEEDFNYNRGGAGDKELADPDDEDKQCQLIDDSNNKVISMREAKIRPSHQHQPRLAFADKEAIQGIDDDFNGENNEMETVEL